MTWVISQLTFFYFFLFFHNFAIINILPTPSEMTGTNNYFNFLKSKSGESWDAIMRYNEYQLESSHTFIQWIFPTTTQSRFNENCPVISLTELRRHSDFNDAKSKMIISLSLMKNHWGINSNKVVDISKFKRLSGQNGLRLSRVIQSLIYHDLCVEASDLLSIVLSNLQQLNVWKVNGITIWQNRYNEAIEETASFI